MEGLLSQHYWKSILVPPLIYFDVIKIVSGIDIIESNFVCMTIGANNLSNFL